MIDRLLDLVCRSWDLIKWVKIERREDVLIQSRTKTHATSKDVRTQVMIYFPDKVMTDGAALAVASWYQSARGHGATFARLASTGQVDHMELIEAIELDARLYAKSGSDHKALTMLIMWALDKVSKSTKSKVEAA
jgi:hypothetical protein